MTSHLHGPQASSGACPFEYSSSSAQPSFNLKDAVLRRRDCDDNRGERGRTESHSNRNDCCSCDPPGGQLTVDGNTVNTGRYTIAGSTDASGTLTVTDNKTGESFKVWGDPHITTDKGDAADFQHAPATFDLPDGTQVTVNPTNNSGVNTINDVTITKGNDAVTMTGFQQGNLQTQAHPGEGYLYDAFTPHGTVLTADHGNIDQLDLPNGTQISGNNVPNIDGYANHAGSPQQIAKLVRTEMTMIQEQISMFEQETFQMFNPFDD